MGNRVDKTLADYLVIAISPALIMTLIGSLVYFLLNLFYQGTFNERLHYLLTLFIFAAVLIGRIAIEEGKERAILFAAFLAFAVLLAINQFVEFHGEFLARFSFFINLGLIGLIWWCAHRLTWDCTMIDETEPGSGEGLLDAAGLGRRPETSAAAPGDAARHGSIREWWQAAKKKPHAPGVSIVYFSLAALPLFGLGQLAIPAAQTERRRYAFCLLAIYVASALALLLTTSFLGLRRYLRQRRLPMPQVMANTWIVLGCLLILFVMGFALFIPRPNAEYAVSQIPSVMGSPDQTATRRGWGREGVKSKDRKAAKSPRPAKDAEQATASGPSDKTGDSKTAGDDKSSPSSKGGGKQASGGDKQSPSSSDSPQPKPPPEAAKSDAPNDGKKSNTAGEKTKGEGDSSKSGGEQSMSDGEKSKDGGSSQQNGEKPQESPALDKPEKVEKTPPVEKPNEAPPPEPAPPNPAPPETPQIPDVSSPLAALLPIVQLLFYAVVIGLMAWWAWRNWAKVKAAIREFLAALRELWEQLGFRKKRPRGTGATEAATSPALRRFADYADPFATGQAARMPAGELVRYTFVALEAWSRENGWPRDAEQTPHEFARALARRNESLAQPALRLAELYCEAAYAPGLLRAVAAQPLQELWQIMRREGVQTPVSLPSFLTDSSE